MFLGNKYFLGINIFSEIKVEKINRSPIGILILSLLIQRTKNQELIIIISQKKEK
jgi:hypothetical protein